jgi:drug/metabolite transporter (DMT)-like permease
MQDSSMASDLMARGQGEMLEMLEQPVMPDAPYAPKRPLIVSLGVLAGLALGIALAGGREIKDSSLKNLKDVRAYTRLTVLGSIPLLENDFVLRRRRRFAWLMWTAALLLGVLLMAGSITFYYMSRA